MGTKAMYTKKEILKNQISRIFIMWDENVAEKSWLTSSRKVWQQAQLYINMRQNRNGCTENNNNKKTKKKTQNVKNASTIFKFWRSDSKADKMQGFFKYYFLYSSAHSCIATWTNSSHKCVNSAVEKFSFLRSVLAVLCVYFSEHQMLLVGT